MLEFVLCFCHLFVRRLRFSLEFFNFLDSGSLLLHPPSQPLVSRIDFIFHRIATRSSGHLHCLGCHLVHPSTLLSQNGYLDVL